MLELLGRNKLVITAPLMPISGLIRPAVNSNSRQLTSFASSGQPINFSRANFPLVWRRTKIIRRFYERVKNVYWLFGSARVDNMFLFTAVRLSNCRLLLRGRGAAGARSLQRLQQIDPACSKYDTEGGR